MTLRKVENLVGATALAMACIRVGVLLTIKSRDG
jgi:hypothetical protein